MTWDPRKYGTREDPIRQSDLGQLAGRWGCGRRFEFRKHEEAASGERTRDRAYGVTCRGTAVHETLARFLRLYPKEACAGKTPPRKRFEQVLLEEFERATGGLEVIWKKGERELDMLAEGVEMVMGVLRTLPEYAVDIVMVEAPFLAPIESKGKAYWTTGTGDLVYRPRRNPSGLGLVDWKTGKTKPGRIGLDHGYQFGIYARALEAGLWWPDGTIGDESDAVTIGEYPSEIYLGHLRDFLPYKRKGRRTLTDLDAEWAGGRPGDKHAYEAGDLRGPGWYPSRRTEADDARLRVSIRTLVGTVRLGRFIESIDDDCARCPYRDRCLTEGHELQGEEAAELAASLRGVEDHSGLDEVA